MCIYVYVYEYSLTKFNVSLMNLLSITTAKTGYCMVTFLLLFTLIDHFREII